ncbi:hypothetical protein GGI12_003634 [Dipsacomyces acuminosporus]|nr:hypothetical protein GGI12_003634 [Dipsacomyces acuminosporus]
MSKCAIVGALNALPFGETEHGRAFFWGTIVLSWLLTFVPQNGRRNYSIVDRAWPLLPSVFSLIWVFDRYQQTQSIDVAALLGSKLGAAQLLVLVWSIRMTYNSLRRGDYRYAAEDYRWAHVRASIKRLVGGNEVVFALVWELFNILFISVFQISLLYLLAVPLRLLHQNTSNGVGQEWSIAEGLLAVKMAALLVLEAIADNQQFELQTLKHTLDEVSDRAYAERKRKEVEAGFVHTGLWRYSRHPNVLCEQGFWFTLSAFCLVASKADPYSCQTALYYAGPVILSLLMWGSISLTESISASKYPLYRAYQLKTSKLVPWVPSSNATVIKKAHKYQ